MPASDGTGGRFDIHAIARGLPDRAATLLIDAYLSDRPAASVRVFRFWMEDAAAEAEFGLGHLLLFDRGTVHALPKILEEPLVFLSVDTPRRAPTDIVFVNPEDGTPATFMARNAEVGMK